VVKRLINTSKMMITIFWNPFGIHILAALPEKTSFDAEYFFDYALILIEELSVMHVAAIQEQTLVIHMDNLPIHKSKPLFKKCINVGQKCSLSTLLTGSCSIRLFLFGYLKQKIASQKFVSLDDLLEAIREEFDHRSRSVFESVLDDWMIHLQTCINYHGSYFPDD
jgi:hypothetical protein